jgi:hypothetical protein
MMQKLGGIHGTRPGGSQQFVWVPASTLVRLPRSPTLRAILSHMNAVRGRVRGGHIETDAALPEGTEVVVLTGGEEEPFDLDDAQLVELEARMAEADEGEIEPAEAVLGKLRRGR